MKKIIKALSKNFGIEVRRVDKSVDRYRALYHKYKEYTMISEQYFVLNLELCNNFKHVKGDYVECGVWRGGMSAAISEILGKDRQLHLFDSFEGLPEAKEIDGKEAMNWQLDKDSPEYFNNCTAEESYAIKAMEKSENLNYRTYKGWFENTLHTYPKKSIAILRLDADWYASIKICLESLYEFVTPGGIIILDDYYTWDGCAKAVHDYLAEGKRPSRIHEWKGKIPYILKKND